MITFIPTPIGNPQDITIRAMRIFEQAELLFINNSGHNIRREQYELFLENVKRFLYM